MTNNKQSNLSDADVAAAIKDAYQRGFDEAFVRGVSSIREIWSALITPLSNAKLALEEIEHMHDSVFEIIEGRAEGAPTLADLPPEQWNKITGKWEDIKKRFGSSSSPKADR